MKAHSMGEMFIKKKVERNNRKEDCAEILISLIKEEGTLSLNFSED
jgi:hypothetical protein